MSSQQRMEVWRGTRLQTSGGLRKSDLIKNKRGKIVSKKASANGKKAYKRIAGWNAAVAKARTALGIKGFCAVNGKKGKGKELYAKAKSLYKK